MNINWGQFILGFIGGFFLMSVILHYLKAVTKWLFDKREATKQ